MICPKKAYFVVCLTGALYAAPIYPAAAQEKNTEIASDRLNRLKKLYERSLKRLERFEQKNPHASTTTSAILCELCGKKYTHQAHLIRALAEACSEREYCNVRRKSMSDLIEIRRLDVFIRATKALLEQNSPPSEHANSPERTRRSVSDLEAVIPRSRSCSSAGGSPLSPHSYEHTPAHVSPPAAHEYALTPAHPRRSTPNS